MNPHTDESNGAFGTWWRRWAGTIALVVLVVGGIGGFVRVESNQDRTQELAQQNTVTATALAEVVQRLDSEAHEREVQFCGLVLGNFEDRAHRLGTTKEYLHSEAGREPTALNLYIREISLPQSEAEVDKEREDIPDLCWKYKP